MQSSLTFLASDPEECALLLSSGVFDPDHYAAQCGLPADADLLRHYLDVGWRWGLEPRPDFEGAYLQPFYEATGAYGPPLPSTRGEAEARANRIRASTLFDSAWYGRFLPEGIDPALHYVIAGEAAGWRPSMQFDPLFYSERHDDVFAAGVSPFLHFVEDGQRERRAYRAAAEALSFPNLAGIDSKRVVLMLLHEASRTGAPLLGYALVAELRKHHAMIPVLLRFGPLESDFTKICPAVIGPMRWEEWHPAEMSRLADRLVETYNPLYAVANSIETSQLIPHLAVRGVPSVALVHEFASYTKPRTKLADAFNWASDIVFPADLVAKSAFDTFPNLCRRKGIHVLPQGRVDPPRAADADFASRPESLSPAIPFLDEPGAFIVLGAGSVTSRKGVDVFVATAAACQRNAPELGIRFIWIGDGYNPQGPDLYCIYLAEQVQRSGVAQTLKIIEPVLDLNPLYAAADVLLMSSRLDPQPNVAIDALSRGLPVVCFEGASGTSEVLAAETATSELVVPYLDAAAAAAVICGLARNRPHHATLRDAVRRLAEQVFDMRAYAGLIDGFGRAAAVALKPEDFDTLAAADLDIEMIVPPGESVPGAAGLARALQVQWAALGMSEDQAYNAWFRRGHAGFHPQSYAARETVDCVERGAVPLAHWLRAGQPPGPWSRQVIYPLGAPAAAAARVALHGHFYYPELFSELLVRLAANLTRCDLYLTTDTEDKAAALAQMAAGQTLFVSVAVTPNRGRDVGPFLSQLQSINRAEYDLVGHFHSKKSAATDGEMGNRWREFLWANLIGPSPMVDTIAAAFSRTARLGLVMAEDPHIIGWDGNREIAEALARRMQLKTPLDTFFDFPLGTMFWARPAALEQLLNLRLDWDDYPAEPVAYDGTILHAIERLLPFVVRDAGYEIQGARLPGTSW
jgi:glycosyltransferase involved in cell wall biosynthesis